MALFPHSLYFIIHTVLDKENNRKSNRLPLGQRICFRMDEAIWKSSQFPLTHTCFWKFL